MAYIILVLRQRAGPVDQNSNLSPGLIWPSADHSRYGDLVFPRPEKVIRLTVKL